jgi:hypothetical protein
MVEIIFDACVAILLWLAGRLGMSYEAVNVWIFVLIWPAVTITMVAMIIAQRLEIRRLREQGQEPRS